MKQNKLNILTILFLCVTLVFTACNNSAVPKEQGITLTGKIDYDANALPAELLTENNSRAAYFDGSNVSLDFDLESFTVVGIEETTGYKVHGQVLLEETGNYYYNITLPIQGNWDITINGKSQGGILDLYGHTSVLAEDESYLSLQSEGRITLVPLIKEGQRSDISIKVRTTLPQENASDSDVYTVWWRWDEETKPAGVEDQSVTMPYAVESFSDPFTFTNVPTGTYKVKIQFVDNNGNTLLTCEQWIHVFANCTTNTWYGSGSQYTKDNTGKTWLSLTQDALDFFKTPEAVTYPEKMIFYTATDSGVEMQIVSESNYNADDKHFDDGYSFGTPAGYTLPNGNEPEADPGNTVFRDVCFNANDGSVYSSAYVRDTEGMYNEVIFKYKNGSITPCCFPVTEVESSGNYGSDSSDDSFYYVSALYYDNSAKKLYGMVQGYHGAGKYFPKFWEYDEANDQYGFYNGSIMTNTKINAFIVRDGYLYFCDYDKGGLKMKLFELEYIPGNQNVDPPVEDEYNLYEISSKQIIDLAGQYNIDHEVTVTDMISIEDNFYILVNDSYRDSGNLNSRGAIFKYNPITRTCSELNGLVTTDLFEDEDEIKFTCSKSPDSVEMLYKDQYMQPDQFYPITANTKDYAPSNIESTEGFYGPQKILAYNSNYLFIADSGQNFKLDSNKKISYEPINRIAKVSVQDMTIQEVLEIDSETPFITAGILYLPGVDNSGEGWYGDGYTYTGIKYPFINKEL